MRNVFHSGWLPQASAQRPHTFPIQELLGDLSAREAERSFVPSAEETLFRRVKPGASSAFYIGGREQKVIVSPPLIWNETLPVYGSAIEMRLTPTVRPS